MIATLALVFRTWLTRVRRRLEAVRPPGEERYRRLVEGLPHGIVEVDLEGRIAFANGAFERIIGAEPGGAVGLDALGLYESPDERERDRRLLASGDKGEAGSLRRRLRTLDGRSILVEGGFRDRRDEAGRRTGFVFVGTDVTEREAAGQRLDESPRLADRVAELSPLALFVADVQRRKVVYVSPGVEQQLGYSAEEITAMEDPAAALVHPGDRVGADPLAAWAVRPRGPDESVQLACRIRHKDGGWRLFEFTTTVFTRAEDGTPVRLLGVARDSTDDARRAETLRKSEALLRSVVDKTPAVIYVKGVDGRYVLVNDQFETVFNLSREDVQGKTDLDVFPKEFAATLREHDERVIEAGKPYMSEEFVPRSGELHTYLSLKFPLLDEAGEIYATCGIATDVTQSKRAEQKRLRLEAQVEHSQKLESLGILAGGIAHDFNNLLLAILGNAALAQAALGSTSPVRMQLEDIEAAASRAAELCTQLLAYSGKGRFQMEALDVNRRIRDVIHLLAVSISRHASLHLELDPELPAVEADPAQFDQVIMNLLTNASDAIGEGRGVISVVSSVAELDEHALRGMAPSESVSPGRYVAITVEDSGCGMKPEVLQRIFDPFFTTKFAGRGLGMAAVLGIVRGHEGGIHVDSEPGRGSTVHVFLPAADAAVVAAPPEAAAPEVEWRGSGTLLVVDDEETVRDLARRILEPMGFTVWTAADGHEALRTFCKHQDEIRLVLLDLTMPELSGEETYRAMQRVRADLPVILSSGYGKGDLVERLATSGLAGFLQKPYRPGDLVAAIRRALEPSGR